MWNIALGRGLEPLDHFLVLYFLYCTRPRTLLVVAIILVPYAVKGGVLLVSRSQTAFFAQGAIAYTASDSALREKSGLSATRDCSVLRLSRLGAKLSLAWPDL